MARSTAAVRKTPPPQFIAQTHPLYDEWRDTWRLAGENYEGDGGYLDGTNLIGHPREYRYDAQGVIVGAKEKLTRRRMLARYDNFAQALTDVFVDHQYAKAITRTFVNPKKPNDDYLRWIEDVDGEGTHLDDWLKEQQTLAHTFGHLMVLMDRGEPDPALPRSRANQGRLVLREYTPADTLDWLAPRKKLTAIKFVEAIERDTLQQPSTFSQTNTARAGTTGEATDGINLEYLLYNETGFRVFRGSGDMVRQGTHGFGELPVVPFYSRRRSRIPILGRPLLRDPRLFRDHFNMVSELRDILRSQTFSMLNIQLGEGQNVDEARALLGENSGTDTVLFTLGPAAFVAPLDGPAATLVLAISDSERKMFRLVNLPWEGDSRDAEAAESRRLKAMDLNRTLAGYADETQAFDYKIARLFYIGFYGRRIGLQKWLENPPVIQHPDEFNTEEIIAAAEDTKAALGLQLGPTAEKLLRKRMVPLVLKDLDPATRETVDREIDASEYNPMHAAGKFETGPTDKPATEE